MMKKIIDYIDYEIADKVFEDKGIFAIASYNDPAEDDIVDFIISGNSMLLIEAIIDAMKEDCEIEKIILSAANAYRIESPSNN